MDPDQSSSSARRKVRFLPKGPPRRKQKTTGPETDGIVGDDNEDATGDGGVAQSLLRRVNEHLGRQGPKVDNKPSVQVAFAHGTTSSDSVRTYGVPREGESDENNGSGSRLKCFAADEQTLFSLPSTAEQDGIHESYENLVDASYQKEKKDYIEPWDYHGTDYPITLPLRRPYSGNPELLDEAEFGDGAMNSEYDENTVNPALELGLLEELDKPQMLFFQFPLNLPIIKQPGSADGKERTGSFRPSGSRVASEGANGKEIAGGSMSLGNTVASAAAKGKEKMGNCVPLRKANPSKMCCSLEDLSGGYMGKMLVYKSGAIKWKLGDVVYDVSPGVGRGFPQDVVAINTVDKNCCALGELNKQVVVTPDIDSMLDNVIDLG
ncbi:uncharacterized protein LOC127789474 [Diospyros lotus]|uniref:uncharacterized protein LOC127789474 n=1 Tax=Diospyros lotus TaxID=55363 RepID=UPI0022582518|nr:uncharacterized protein LOC127789474 [Diospyros lotus]